MLSGASHSDDIRGILDAIFYIGEDLLARYGDAALEPLEEADGKKRRTVYNALGVAV